MSRHAKFCYPTLLESKVVLKKLQVNRSNEAKNKQLLIHLC